MKYFSTFVISLVLLGMNLYAQDAQVLKDGPIHEAYLTREAGETILDAYPDAPPHPIRERIPPQTDPKTRWIPGYWEFSKEHDEYVWVSGVWRRPPPGRSWIEGRYEQYPEGWVRIPGFWSAIPARELRYVSTAPPNLLDEKAPPSPGASYFWIPGYWRWDDGVGEYVWYGGRWQAQDPDWVYVPARIIWRSEGYIFIPAYWDWPLEDRGDLYAPVLLGDVEPGFFFEPVVILSPFDVIEICYPHYPFYLCFYGHYSYYHPHFWHGWGQVPPWWGWQSWWCFSWVDQLWLWWWWSHPGYPQPFWMNAALADMLLPPDAILLNLMKGIDPFLFVGPDGVIGPAALLNAIERVTDSHFPVMPFDEEAQEDIFDEADVERPSKILEPGATRAPRRPPQKPYYGPDSKDQKFPPRLAPIPPKPSVDVRPPIRRYEPRRPDRTQRPKRPRPETRQPRYPRPTPPSSGSRPRPRPQPSWPPEQRPRPPLRPRPPAPESTPSTPIPPRYQPEIPPPPTHRPSRPRPEFQSRPRPSVPETAPPRYQPEAPPPPIQRAPSRPRPRPEFQPRPQRSQPEIQWPRRPQALQPQGEIQGRPQPQRNPGMSIHTPPQRYRGQ